ncbi:MAG: signal peptidase I [Bacteroidota bacterium]|nr:signal peptidase I [Bacteroidota bacterium]
MNPTNFSTFLLVYLPIYILSRIGLFLMFRKANAKHAWMAFFPIICNWPWIQIVGRPKTWMLWSLVPAANVIIWFSLVIDLLESFGKFKFWQQVAGVLFPFIVFPQIGFDKKYTYLGSSRDLVFRKKHLLHQKTWQREWSDAIFFALIVAYLIRTFQLEPYKIPTSSMEDSMLVGDFLFVSKMNYGPRFPITPIAFPLVHQDFLGVKAYSDALHLPYMRLPGFQSVKRNDPVVFNVPWDQLDPTVRAPDKMQNYVKRCVAIPGDTLQIKDGVLFINGKEGYRPAKQLHNYFIKFKPNSTIPTFETLTKEYDIYDYMIIDNRTYSMALTLEDLEKIKSDFQVDYVKQDIGPKEGNHYAPDYIEFNAIIKVKAGQKLSDEDLRKLGVIYNQPISSNLENLLVMMNETYIEPQKYSEIPKIDSIKRKTQLLSKRTNAFPDEMQIYPWNKDNYGPMYLPKRGDKIAINAQNFYFYYRAIVNYEGNTEFELRGSTPYLNGQMISEYEFKMDYYWMMGDNRDNSLDSRFWGYVPENHIVGKPLFVFFSIQYKRSENPKPGSDGNEFVKIRWHRLFKAIK